MKPAVYFSILLTIVSLNATAQNRSLETLVKQLETTYQIDVRYDSIEVAPLKLESKIRKQRYGFVLQLNKFDITLQPDTVILKRHLTLLIEEFKVYPKDYFERIGMKSLCLLESIYYGKSRREAAPDDGRGVLMLESSARLIDNTTYLKYAFHHDLHHYAEVGADIDRFKLWKKWDKLNPKKFEYFGTGAMQDEKKYAHLDFGYVHPREGFITNYAMTAAVEDRAEMAAYIIIPEYRVDLWPLLEEDKLLVKKVDFMLDLFSEISGTKENYWTKAMMPD